MPKPPDCKKHRSYNCQEKEDSSLSEPDNPVTDPGKNHNDVSNYLTFRNDSCIIFLVAVPFGTISFFPFLHNPVRYHYTSSPVRNYIPWLSFFFSSIHHHDGTGRNCRFHGTGHHNIRTKILDQIPACCQQKSKKKMDQPPFYFCFHVPPSANPNISVIVFARKKQRIVVTLCFRIFLFCFI